ncbi:MAG: ABC transporter permease [Thermoplasmatota archaeon]
MGFGRWMSEHIGELVLVGILFLMTPMVFVGFLVPTDYRGIFLIPALFFLILLFIVILILALSNKLQLMMGLRNLVRHKSDTVIAILGFMIGTSIICSSLAIGDTMSNMIESLVYDTYYLRDEYLYVTDEEGGSYLWDGDNATMISDLVWSLNENETLIDGVSWELLFSAPVSNEKNNLFEPIVSLKAFSPETESAFGSLERFGVPVEYDLGMDEVFITDEVSRIIEADVGDDLRISSETYMGGRVFKVKEIVDSDGRAAWGSNNIFLSFPALWDLFNITNATAENPGLNNNWTGGYYNMLFISNKGGVVSGADLCSKVVRRLNEKLEKIPHPVDTRKNLEVTYDKQSNVDMATSQMSQFTTMFLTFGTFSIIAGITLIINIFVMLSEERKEEMGISRAVGMKKRHLRMVYLFEGTAYSFMSSFVGVILGAITGYGIIFAVQKIIDSMTQAELEILEYYTVSPFSLILAFIGGFSITIGTTILITQLIANLNIVSAIRNTPIPKVKGKLIVWAWKKFGAWDQAMMTGDGTTKAKVINFLFDRVVLSGAIMFLIGSFLFVIGFLTELIWPVFLGISLNIIGIGLLIRFFANERITYNIVAVLILIIYIIPTPEPVASFGANLEMFIISGIFMVTAGVLLLVWNTDIILWGIEKVITAIRMSPAAIKMAISYPIKKRFRTGVTIFMFALIIFTITTLSMMVHTFNINIKEIEKDVGGGYDIIGISLFPIDNMEEGLLREKERGNSDAYDLVDWDRTVSLKQGILYYNMTLPFGMGNQEVQTGCGGISDKFIETNRYGFNDIAWEVIDPNGSMERNDRNVWNALKDSPDWVIVDSSWGENEYGPPGMGSALKAGDNISVVSATGVQYNKTIIGISKLMGYRSVFLYDTYAEEQFSVRDKVLHLISIRGDVDTREAANELRKALYLSGFYAIVVEELLEQVLEIQNNFFNLFKAFLALGLIIGIVGLGIVTLRSVYERRHEIGMMRAIGFKRLMVVGAFLGESAFIAGSGLFIGTVLGIILGWILWRDELRKVFPEFGIPWVELLLIGGGAFLVALLSSIAPSLKAARVIPAEALRYE